MSNPSFNPSVAGGLPCELLLQVNAHTLDTEAQVKPLVVSYPLDQNAVGVFHGGRTCAARDRRACRDCCVNSIDVGQLRQAINSSRSGVLADTDLHDR